MKEKKRRKKNAIEETPLPKEDDQSDSVEHNITQTSSSNEASSSCLPNSPEKSQDSDDGRIATGAEVDGSSDQLIQLQLMAKVAAASKRRKQNEEIFELSDDDDGHEKD